MPHAGFPGSGVAGAGAVDDRLEEGGGGGPFRFEDPNPGLERVREKHPREAHYYLFILGTRPQWQSQGVGSALMKVVLDRADREGTPAYLEASSERSQRLYLRHGFTVTGELRLRDSPPLWSMWRAPSPR